MIQYIHSSLAWPCRTATSHKPALRQTERACTKSLFVSTTPWTHIHRGESLKIFLHTRWSVGIGGKENWYSGPFLRLHHWEQHHLRRMWRQDERKMPCFSFQQGASAWGNKQISLEIPLLHLSLSQTSLFLFSTPPPISLFSPSLSGNWNTEGKVWQSYFSFVDNLPFLGQTPCIPGRHCWSPCQTLTFPTRAATNLFFFFNNCSVFKMSEKKVVISAQAGVYKILIFSN